MSNSLNRASRSCCPRHIRTAKFLLRCPSALRYIEEDTADVSAVPHLQNNVLLTSIEEDSGLRHNAVCRYLTQNTKRQVELPTRSFYESRAHRELDLVLPKVRDGNPSKYGGAFCLGILNTGILLLRRLASTVQIVFINTMKRFHDDRCARDLNRMSQNLSKQRKNIRRIQNLFSMKAQHRLSPHHKSYTG